MIKCKHWINCGVYGGGCCDIEVFGPQTVGYSICLNHCPKYDGPDRTEAIKQLQAAKASPPKPTNGQLISSFAAATTALYTQGRIPRLDADDRLIICTGKDSDGRFVTDKCPSYKPANGPRGSGHCGSCGCPQWPISQMRHKVWYPYPICPKGLFPTVEGRRLQNKRKRELALGVA